MAYVLTQNQVVLWSGCFLSAKVSFRKWNFAGTEFNRRAWCNY